MAYVNQEKKAVIAAELKKCMPKGWKYTLSVRDHSEITMIITAAPVDIIGEMNSVQKANAERRGQSFHPIDNGHVQLGHVVREDNFIPDGKIFPVLEKALKALRSAGWYDNSNLWQDHFDTAYYYGIHIGRWNKPFVNTAALTEKNGGGSSVFTATGNLIAMSRRIDLC